MKLISRGILLFLLAVILLTLSGVFFIIDETEQAIITKFGKIIGDPITEAGLKTKMPIISKVRRMEKRAISWDGAPEPMPTRDKLYISVDTFARWKIKDPKLYFKRLKEQRRASSRLDDILGGETRNAVAGHDLIEIIRSTKDRKASLNLETQTIVKFDPIKRGRLQIENEIRQKAAPKLDKLGIELLDIRFKRVNYNPQVESRIYERMISERQQIAERFRSEGAGEAAKILGTMEKEVNKIQSEAYKKEQNILGDAEAEATKIYAKAYDKNKDARELYQFLKSLELYKKSLDENTSLIMSSDNKLWRLLEDY